MREICQNGGPQAPRFAMAPPAMASLASRGSFKLHRAHLPELCVQTILRETLQGPGLTRMA